MPSLKRDTSRLLLTCGLAQKHLSVRVTCCFVAIFLLSLQRTRCTRASKDQGADNQLLGRVFCGS
jgi:hypothetical protein